MRNFILLVVSMLFLSILNTGCVYSFARTDGPYEGKIVDADTKQPIEGVVVLGIWCQETPTVGGAVSSYYDSKETLTDRNGFFRIDGKGRLLMSKISIMDVKIFKEGYGDIGVESWLEIKRKWGGEKKVIIPLRRLTIEQRRKNSVNTADIPSDKQPMLIKEINKDRVNLGLTPFGEGN